MTTRRLVPSPRLAPSAAARLVGLLLAAGCGSGDPGTGASASESTSTAGTDDPTEATPTGGAATTATSGPDPGMGTGTGGATTGDATTGGATTGDMITGDATTGDATTATTGDATIGDATTGDASTGAGAACGDGVVQPGEACDDGDPDDSDACTNACEDAVCGDGIVQVGVEACDDGDDDDTDACTNACTVAVCGDGIVGPDEECDDGNLNNLDACPNICKEPPCGDGVVARGGLEECDDGNQVNTDGCLNACLLALCGDEVVHAGVEACDDGNGADDDGCEANCSPTLAAVEAGGEHTCTLSAKGGVRCWGAGDSGRLGHGDVKTIGDDEVPAAAGDVPVGAVALQVSAGDQHVCAVLVGGGVRCWGAGGSGRLGYGNTNNIGDDETPASVGTVNIGASVVKITAGDLHTCAMITGGKVRCWGGGSAGRLGYGNTNDIGDDEAPAAAGDVKVGVVVLDISAGDDHTCVLAAGGKVRCWGRGSDGQLGYGNVASIGDNEVPSTAGDVDVGGAVKQISAGQTHTCALLDSGAVRCWGASASGELGYGKTATIGDNETPASAGDVPVGGAVVQIAAGWHHTCALMMTGGVRCWGSGAEGRLGYGNTNNIGDNETPASAGDVDVGGPAVAVTAGRHHTCAILAGGALRCWGSGSFGKLGHANLTTIGDDEAPAAAGAVSVY